MSLRSFNSRGDLSLEVNKAAAISLLSSWEIDIKVTDARSKSGTEEVRFRKYDSVYEPCYSDVKSMLIKQRP